MSAHRARRDCLAAGEPLPKLRKYVDFLGDATVLVARTLLGAIAGAVFHSQLTTSATAVAVAIGASAPLLLRQLGHIASLNKLLSGADTKEDTEIEPDGGRPRLPSSDGGESP